MRKILILTAAAVAALTLSGCITRACDNKPVKACDAQKPPIGWNNGATL